MKLVDILARRLKSWPEQAVTAVQDLDGEVKFDHSHEMPRINKSKDVWIRQGDQGDSIHPEELAEDCSHAIVTRAQWQAAVDALNAPKTDEWGRGELPPVGSPCEAGSPQMKFPNEREWRKVEVLAHGVFHGVPVAICQDGPTILTAEASVFRPIRTPEQIAADERHKALIEMLRSAPAMTTCVAGALYDAGYRKTSTTDN